ncbi:MAG: flavin reductase family protein [Acutalibacteraceae bacterium]
MAQFREINPSDITENAFKLIGKDWMLVTAGDSTKLNTMTASWGGIGVLWNKNVAFSFIRPQRYTLEFIDQNEYYTLSFLQDGYRDTLTFCGRNSGRDVDKIKEKNLTPVFDENAPYFEQAKLVLVCKKLYKQAMTPDSFIDKALIEKNYPDNDFHYAFVGEIVKVLIKDV